MKVNVETNSRETLFRRLIQSQEITHRLFNHGECIELTINDDRDLDETTQRVSVALNRDEVKHIA